MCGNKKYKILHIYPIFGYFLSFLTAGFLTSFHFRLNSKIVDQDNTLSRFLLFNRFRDGTNTSQKQNARKIDTQ